MINLLTIVTRKIASSALCLGGNSLTNHCLLRHQMGDSRWVTFSIPSAVND